MATSVRRMQHFVYLVLALMVPVLVDGVSTRRLEVTAASASSFEHDADGDGTPQDNQDQTAAQQLALFVARAPAAPRAAIDRSVRLPIAPALVPRPAPVWTPARPSTSAIPLRC